MFTMQRGNNANSFLSLLVFDKRLKRKEEEEEEDFRACHVLAPACLCSYSSTGRGHSQKNLSLFSSFPYFFSWDEIKTSYLSTRRNWWVRRRWRNMGYMMITSR
jgi:hypothetical protein